MLELSLCGIRLKMSFSFFAILAVVLAIDSRAPVLTALLCCLFHELGHIFFMCLYGIPPKSILLYGGGFRLEPNRGRMISVRQDVTILLAGSGANLALYGFSTLFFAGAPALATFARANLIFGLFNLLPFKYFDGGQVAEKLFGESHHYATVRIYRLVRLVLAGLVAGVLFYLVFFCKMNASLLLTLLYVVVSELFF
ncbi:MAG: hypothetical protein QM689_11030 [Oscillospiraceae bacterium]